jgi:glycosyltransferase involved in cell wall biosynthesis
VNAFVLRHFTKEWPGAIQTTAVELSRRIPGTMIISDGPADRRFERDGVVVQELQARSGREFFRRFATWRREERPAITHFLGSMFGSYLMARSLGNPRGGVVCCTPYNAGLRLSDFTALRRADLLRVVHRNMLLSLAQSAIPPRSVRGAFARAGMAVVAPSERMATASRKVAARASAVYVVPHGVDTRQFSPLPPPRRAEVRERCGLPVDADPLVLYFGHDHVLRGIDTLVDAFPHVRRALPNATLALMLSARQSLDMRLPFTRTRDYGGDGIVVRRGTVERREELLGAVDVVALPYRYAGELPEFPMVLLEAMSMGQPVVTTPIGALPELIESGVNGMLARPGSASAVADAIIRLGRDEELRSRMGQMARCRVAAFDWDIVTDRLGQVYTELGAA